MGARNLQALRAEVARLRQMFPEPRRGWVVVSQEEVDQNPGLLDEIHKRGECALVTPGLSDSLTEDGKAILGDAYPIEQSDLKSFLPFDIPEDENEK